MADLVLANALAGLLEFERATKTAPEMLPVIEGMYGQLAEVWGSNSNFAFAFNRFRVRNASRVSVKRPQVIYGSRPNIEMYHLVPLMELADVMIVAFGQGPNPPDDLIYLDPETQGMEHVLTCLPEGFHPAFYYENQACYAKWVIRGLECAPFPTVATLCHHYWAFKVDAIARQYDYVLPLSPRYCEILKRTVDPAKIIELPFGTSWGSFSHNVNALPETPRSVDVLLTFPEHALPCYGPYRVKMLDLFAKAEAKFGDRFKFARLPARVARPEYLDALTNARVVLNVVSINGPYNYRTCEAINAGAVLMQYDTRYATGPQGMENYLVPGEEFVLFDENDFMAKLENLLTSQEICNTITHRAQKRMEEYAYPRLYRDLFAKVADKKDDWRVRRTGADSMALARVLQYMNISGPTQFLAVQDVLAASAASGIAPLSLIMPFYKILQETAGPDALADLVGGLPQTPDLALRRLAFYDRVMADIPNPSTVDRFNYLVLCAGDGRLDAKACRDLKSELLTGPQLDRNEMARVTKPDVAAVPSALVNLADMAVRNYGFLLGDDDAARQAAARDFMLIWVYWLEALAGITPDESRQAAKDILEGYPMWDGAKVPDYVEPQIPAEAAA